MLAFDSDCIIIVIDMTVLARWTSLKPVSCVNLHARLGGQHLEQSSAFRGIQLCRCLNLVRLGAVDHEAVVITLAIFQCRKICPDILSDRLCRHEIHRRTCNISRLTEWYQRLVSRKEL